MVEGRAPLFVGGTGRSGTTAISRLIGAHPAYTSIPVEARFHAAKGGLPDLLDGAVSLKQFLDRLRGRFYMREWSGGGAGLHWVLTGQEVHRAAWTFERRFPRDPDDASRALIRTLFDAVAAAAGTRGWVEMTPATIVAAPHLARLLPRARFVHAVRDGRDVATSVARLRWGPRRVSSGLRWWAEGLRRAHRACRGLEDRVLVVHLEDLVADRREEAFEELRRFCRLQEHPALRAFFDREISPERAHIGRWRTELSGRRQARIDRLYRSLVAGLVADGVTCVPRLDDLDT